MAGPGAEKYAKGLAGGVPDGGLFESAVRQEREINEALMSRTDGINPHAIHEELGNWMTENVTVIRNNAALKKTDEKIVELLDKCRQIALPDRGPWANQELVFARQLSNMLALARVIALGAWRRNESRGSHYKPEFPERDDAHWLKTTKAKFVGEESEPEFSYEDVDTQFIKPRPRKY